MYEPSLEEIEAFGCVDINSNDIYFNGIDCFMVDAQREDFATKPYLQLLGAAEIAYHIPEFFGYNVPDSYICGDRRVYFYKSVESGTIYEVIVTNIINDYDSINRYIVYSCNDFYTVEDAKSFMFRLVLCWLKQESEK